MDQHGLRAHALRDIKQVRWTPSWGEQRMTSMIETRPDWCISRQRVWGVPLALFVHKETAALHPRTEELLQQVAARVEVGGIDAWFALDPAELLGNEAGEYDKLSDVMDVWADSGLSFECLAAIRSDFTAPVDLYLEGSDQHRGWFHSSLLMSEAMYARAPYRGVLTHGFTVDEKGRKMSKSLGNGIEPQDIMRTLGADMLRLWIAATDYANEMSLSQEILKRMSDSYRRMRNTLRFLLGNLHDFEPQQALAGGRAGRARSLGDRAHARAAAGDRERLSRLRVPPDLSEGAQLLRGRSGRLLSRYPEGSPVHHTGGQPRAPLGADRDVAHRREHGALAGADPVVHRRGVVGLSARRRDPNRCS